MLIKLRIFGVLETYLGGDRQEIELPSGAKVRDLLDLIDRHWGHQLPPQLWNTERKRFQGAVLLMSEGVELLDEELPLSDGQQLILLVPLSGG